MVYEYAQGPNKMLWSLPAGRVDGKMPLEAAKVELSQEVQLCAPEDRWIKLGQGFPEGKVGCDHHRNEMELIQRLIAQWITAV